MILPIVAVLLGLGVLVWSADKFVDGAVGVARFCGMSTLLIGMVVVGFGTSAPEMVVSALSAMQNAPELALGNAYGSNIANIALILGMTAIVSPVIVVRKALFRDLPVLMVVTALSFVLMMNGSVSRSDGIILLVVFALVMGVNIASEMRRKSKTGAFARKITFLASAWASTVGRKFPRTSVGGCRDCPFARCERPSYWPYYCRRRDIPTGTCKFHSSGTQGRG